MDSYAYLLGQGPNDTAESVLQRELPGFLRRSDTVSDQDRAQRVRAWVEEAVKTMKVTHPRNKAGLAKVRDYLQKPQATLSLEQAYWLHRFLGGISMVGFKSLTESNIELPKDWAPHYQQPHEEWWFSGWLHVSDGVGDVYWQMEIDRQQYAPYKKGPKKNLEDSSLLKMHMSLMFAREDLADVHFRPVTVSVGSPLVEQDQASLVMGAQRIQSVFPAKLFPMRLEVLEPVSDYLVSLELKSMKEWTSFGTQEHGVGSHGYVYPYCDVSGSLEHKSAQSAVSGFAAHGHSWYYGARPTGVSTDFVRQSLQVLKYSLPSHRPMITEFANPWKLQMWLTDDVQIVGELARYPHKISTLKFDSLRVIENDGTVYEDSPSASLKITELSPEGVPLTWTFTHEVFKSELRYSRPLRRRNQIDHANGTLWQYLSCGQIEGTYQGKATHGYVVTVADSPASQVDQLTEFLHVVPVATEAREVAGTGPSSNQVAAAVFFWVIPGLLFIGFIVMLIIMFKASRVFH